jgi:hypothetical protein
VGDALLGGGVESPTHINTHNERLRRGESTTTIKEFPEGSAGQSFAYRVDILLAVKHRVAVV